MVEAQQILWGSHSVFMGIVEAHDEPGWLQYKSLLNIVIQALRVCSREPLDERINIRYKSWHATSTLRYSVDSCQNFDETWLDSRHG